MPLKLSDFAKQTKEVTKMFPGTESTLTLTIYPNGVTPTIEAAFREAIDAGQATEATLALLVPLLKSWDLLGDDERPIPLAVESLRGVSNMILSFVFETVMEAMKPDPKPATS